MTAKSRPLHESQLRQIADLLEREFGPNADPLSNEERTSKIIAETDEMIAALKKGKAWAYRQDAKGLASMVLSNFLTLIPNGNLPTHHLALLAHAIGETEAASSLLLKALGAPNKKSADMRKIRALEAYLTHKSLGASEGRARIRAYEAYWGKGAFRADWRNPNKRNPPFPTFAHQRMQGILQDVLSELEDFEPELGRPKSKK